MPDNFQQPTNGPRSNPSAADKGLGSKAHETTEKLKSSALERVSDVREKADAQKGQMVERVRRVSSAVREAGDKIGQDEQLIGRFAGVAADRIEQAAAYLSNADPRGAVRDIQAFARRQPAYFFGGAFLLGLVAGRFLKSSQERADAERDQEFYGSDESRDPERPSVYRSQSTTLPGGFGAGASDAVPRRG